MGKDTFSEERAQELFGPTIERMVKIQRYIPSWVLKFVGFPCWFSAVFTMVVFQGMTTSERVIYGMIPAMIGTVCGMILMMRECPPSSH